MKYCTKCGKEIKEGAKFCDSCGEAITKDKKIETKPKDKKNNKKIIIIGTIILFVIIIGTIILSNIIYNNKKVEDYEKFEEQLEVAGENYIKLKGYELDKESNIIIKDIEKANLINNELTDKCDGYVLIEKDEDEDGDYDYNAYIKCGNKYKTKGYNYTYSKKSYIVLKVKESKEEIKDESTKSIDGNDNSTKDIDEEKKCSKYILKIPNINENIAQKYKFSKGYEYAEPNSNYRETLYYSSELTLYKNNIAHIVESDGMAIRSDAYGIYEIKDGILSVKYTFHLDNKEDGTVFDCRDIEGPYYNVNEFTINSDGNLSIPTEKTSFTLKDIDDSNIILEKVK